MNVGIVGTGQLGWMMINEGRRLPHRYFVLGEPGGPASRVADGAFAPEAYRRFVDKCDVVTPEFEHTDLRTLRYASRQGKLVPPMGALTLKLDRAQEKTFLRDRGFPLGEFHLARSPEEARRLARNLGRAVVKASRGGYDGRGQYYLGGPRPSPEEKLPAGEFVVEEYIDFDAEASLLGSRDREGRKLFHTPSFNVNRAGILLSNEAPCEDLGMRRIVSRLLDELDYVGVLAVEFFLVGGRALVNEFAPRVHNSGHHTLHGSSISQFEHHLRIATGLPVPAPVLFRPSGIVNAVGRELEGKLPAELLSLPETHTYSYGKAEVRRRRKMGHVNLTAPSRKVLRERTRRVVRILYGKDPSRFFGA
jgi:5-(carboxyamino)imidazole ribonucleotide synthase